MYASQIVQGSALAVVARRDHRDQRRLRRAKPGHFHGGRDRRRAGHDDRLEDHDRHGPWLGGRMVLAAADFSKEITTTVPWLNTGGLDVRMRAHAAVQA